MTAHNTTIITSWLGRLFILYLPSTGVCTTNIFLSNSNWPFHCHNRLPCQLPPWTYLLWKIDLFRLPTHNMRIPLHEYVFKKFFECNEHLKWSRSPRVASKLLGLSCNAITHSIEARINIIKFINCFCTSGYGIKTSASVNHF